MIASKSSEYRELFRGNRVFQFIIKIGVLYAMITVTVGATGIAKYWKKWA